MAAKESGIKHAELGSSEVETAAINAKADKRKPGLPTAWKHLRLSEITALIVGFLYVSGYYINSIFIRNLGIAPTELFRLEYINIGFAFTLITLGFVFLPVGSFYLTYRVRSSSDLPHFYIGLIGNSLNTALCIGFPLFLAFFATRYEWEFILSTPALGLHSFKSVVITIAALSLTGMIIVPFFERLVNWKASSKLRMPIFRFVVEPIRFGIFIVCLYLIIRSVFQFPWMHSLVSSGIYYLLAGGLFVAGITAAAFWVRYIHNVQGSWPVYGLIGFGLAILYYLAVTSYVFGVYTFIPANRGGRLPLTQAYLEITGHDNLFAGERTIGNIMVRGPVFIIEENTDSLFIASEEMEKWLTGFVPIHVLRKQNVPYIYLERIVNGFPRVTSISQNEITKPASHMFPEEFYQARRVFQYDYIYIDAFFLLVWLILLLKNKEYKALLFGLINAPIIYFIDAYIWWNSPAGNGFPPGTFIREYWIGGTQVPHPLGSFWLLKFGADFMMTISYTLFTFPWLYIVFRNIRQRTLLSKEVVRYTLIWIAMWFLTPLLSTLLPINNMPVEAVRHMNSQFSVWIVNLIIGYGLLVIVYRNNLRIVLSLLGVGVLGALIMEMPLYLFRIRPTGILFVIFEGFFLLNQGVPYLFLLVDKLIPAFQRKRAHN
jgi:hypothetical protein